MKQLTAWKESSKIVSLDVKILVYPGRALFYTIQEGTDDCTVWVGNIAQADKPHTTHTT